MSRRNYFKGFNEFMEQDAMPPDPMGGGMPPQPQPPQKKNVKMPFTQTVGSQMHVPIEQWYTVPFPIRAGTCLGDYDEKTERCDGSLIKETRPFLVIKHDDATVTIRSQPNEMAAWANEKDKTINKIPGMDNGVAIEKTIPREYFDKLVKIPNFPGADFQGPSQTIMRGGM